MSRGVTIDPPHDREGGASREDARAVIAALREPASDVVEAAFDGTSFASAQRFEIIAGWRKMIDTILEEK
jgi:hypothetical protein